VAKGANPQKAPFRHFVAKGANPQKAPFRHFVAKGANPQNACIYRQEVAKGAERLKTYRVFNLRS
jgi:hypothetical protein